MSASVTDHAQQEVEWLIKAYSNGDQKVAVNKSTVERMIENSVFAVDPATGTTPSQETRAVQRGSAALLRQAAGHAKNR